MLPEKVMLPVVRMGTIPRRECTLLMKLFPLAEDPPSAMCDSSSDQQLTEKLAVLPIYT